MNLNKMKILVIFGTRPEGVKLAPIIRIMKTTPNIQIFTCITAQHREMLDQVLDVFDIKPDIDLDLMQQNQSLTELTVNLFTHLESVITKTQPDWIIVQGDTTTVMVTCILAYYHHIKVGHVEAGLRTHDKWQPFPEEINRKIAGAIADLHFAPTEYARQNLLNEGIEDDAILVTGNPVIDALHSILHVPPPDHIQTILDDLLSPSGEKKRLVLVTAHRRENFGDPIESICRAIIRISEKYQSQIQIIYPVHLNPNIHEPVYRILDHHPNITLLQPLDYLPLISIMKHAHLVLTDSGGIQEEATALGIPTLVMRRVTERPEGIEAGVLKLVGTDEEQIYHETINLLEDDAAYKKMAVAKNPYGDGKAAQRIVDALLSYPHHKSIKSSVDDH